MPQIFKFGGYIIFFWSKPNSTKVWITQKGNALLCNNNSQIPSNELRKLLKFIDANSNEIIKKWYEYFEEICYYC